MTQSVQFRVEIIEDGAGDDAEVASGGDCVVDGIADCAADVADTEVGSGVADGTRN